MAEFVYRVRTSQGTISQGTIEADGQRKAVEQLRARRLIILEINEAKKGIALAESIKRLELFKKKVKSKDLVLFSRQLSTMVSSGVPI
ncbi:MAG TPA: type II secretion system F family protein, partial [Elusimicrobia bacterium]|nr:type II secretion system F family protein [Elusimicrobiota bacterium]